MEVVANTEYQDIYRIVDGVLLVVNKFIPIDYSNKTDRIVQAYWRNAKRRRYDGNCQDMLQVLKEDYKDDLSPVVIPKGTVIHGSTPVICTKDKNKWRCELRTSGKGFSGNCDEMFKMLDDVVDCIVMSRKPRP